MIILLALFDVIANVFTLGWWGRRSSVTRGMEINVKRPHFPVSARLRDK